MELIKSIVELSDNPTLKELHDRNLINEDKTLLKIDNISDKEIETYFNKTTLLTLYTEENIKTFKLSLFQKYKKIINEVPLTDYCIEYIFTFSGIEKIDCNSDYKLLECINDIFNRLLDNYDIKINISNQTIYFNIESENKKIHIDTHSNKSYTQITDEKNNILSRINNSKIFKQIKILLEYNLILRNVPVNNFYNYNIQPKLLEDFDEYIINLADNFPDYFMLFGSMLQKFINKLT